MELIKIPKNRTFNFTNDLLGKINKFGNRSEVIRRALEWFVKQEKERKVDKDIIQGSRTITAEIGEKLNGVIEDLCKDNGTPKNFLSVSELTRHAVREYLLYSNDAWIEEQLNPKEPEPKKKEEKLDPVDKYLKEKGYTILRNA